MTQRLKALACSLVMAGPATAVTALAGPASNEASNPASRWEQAFPVAHPDAAVHFTAEYRDTANALHRLEVWRVGTRYLHRRTDERVDLYAVPKVERAGELAYRLVDHTRKAVFDVDRTNLHRIGVFSNWAAQAYVLERPASRYTITPVSAPAHSQAQDCRWQQIRAEGDAAGSTVCWSRRWGLPLVIRTAGQDAPRFRVTAVNAMPSREAATLSALPEIPVGYGYFDSNEEIGPE